MKTINAVLVMLALFGANVTFAAEMCDVYDSAIKHCAKRGCDTNMDDFIRCLVEEEGITDKAEDGTDEIKELVHCFKTEYTCK